eukprot:g1481.t1 g1481   contig10:2175999-2176946(-)
MTVDEKIVFGVSKKGKDSDIHVGDLWTFNEDDVNKVVSSVAESTYKSTRPLGRSHNRGHKLPEELLDSKYRHGVTSNRPEVGAKDLICSSYDDKENSNKNHIKSHGSYGPGQQRTRDYRWNVDPASTTFGIKNNDTAGGRGSSVGVASGLQMTVADDNSRLDKEETATGTVFGKSTSQVTESAAECLKGATTDEDLNDLGRSLTPGFRNALTERCFGCPSIRTDIPRYDRSSVADTQNYGDSVSAGYLLRPSLLSSLGLDENEFTKPRSKSYLHKLFQNCGLAIESDVFDSKFNEASDENGCASIESMRCLLAVK